MPVVQKWRHNPAVSQRERQERAEEDARATRAYEIAADLRREHTLRLRAIRHLNEATKTCCNQGLIGKISAAQPRERPPPTNGARLSTKSRIEAEQRYKKQQKTAGKADTQQHGRAS